jgi:hypothetical protein
MLSTKVQALDVKLEDVDTKLNLVDFQMVKDRLDRMDVDSIAELTKKIEGLIALKDLLEVMKLVDLKTDIIFVATLVSEWFTSADMLATQAREMINTIKSLPPGNERESLKKKFGEYQIEANKFHMMGQSGSTVLEKILMAVAGEEEKRYPSLGKIPQIFKPPQKPAKPPIVPGIPKYTKDNPPPRMSKMGDQKY